MKRDERKERNFMKYNYRLISDFNLQPSIDCDLKMEDIVKQIRQTKRTKEWNDKDDTVRYSNVNLVTKFSLE